MVYLGRPSLGCRTCRSRRIKCDEGKPTCKRCAKSKRECGGYRPEFEIMHRDLTTSTVRRMRKASTTGLQETQQHQDDIYDPESSSSSISPTNTTPQQHQHQHQHQQLIVFVHEQPQLLNPDHHDYRPSPSSSSSLSLPSPGSPMADAMLAVPLAQRAACHFASNVILLPHSGGLHGYMDYLLPLVDSAPPGSCLRYAFNACAFALLGNRETSGGLDLAKLSLKEHTLALARTHAALGDPSTATLDSTLATVLLLSLFESITAAKETRLLAWRTHLEGAINIVRSRGREQLRQTRMGSLLFNAVRQQLIARTLSAGIAPPFGVEWWMMDDESESEDAGACPLSVAAQRLALRTAELRAEVSRLMQDNLANTSTSSEKEDYSRELMYDMLHRVQSADGEIASFLHTILPAYRPQTLCWADWDDDNIPVSERPFYPGRVDVYPDFITAGAWNTARVARLILASINIRLIAWLTSRSSRHLVEGQFGTTTDYRQTAEYATARRICEGTIMEILASVPYQLGWRRTSSPKQGRQRSDTGETTTYYGFACGVDRTTEDDNGKTTGRNKPKALPALMLIWPLVSIKTHDMCTEQQRQWITGRLRYIEERAGLRYAGMMNEIYFRYPSMLIRQDGLMQSPDPMNRQNQLYPDDTTSNNQDHGQKRPSVGSLPDQKPESVSPG
ncbi:hypothetical protein B0H66DRAFT_605759 [Apodospora peruviana]|uniref:Zn(2)-C6 fungal-type domain-containing protein n=1 Tax=Apodospora peruviana TaxID=516989 RepID=A0AAE0HZK9_9PEZI|nr:hypothetical protein B0H66DRAFT_605759 [Apodospora peruviana]